MQTQLFEMSRVMCKIVCHMLKTGMPSIKFRSVVPPECLT